MYLRILKRDLKRKKAMNGILLVFIILAAMFVSSSVNNIIAVLGGIDHFFEKADVPELIAITIDNGSSSIADVMDDIDAIKHYEVQPIIYINPENLLKEGKALDMTGSGFFQPFMDTQLKFFDREDQILTAVESGTVWVSVKHMKSYGIEVGDILEVQFGDVSRTLTVAGSVKDATCLGARFIVNEADFECFTSAPGTFKGSFFYISTDDAAATRTAINSSQSNILWLGSPEKIRVAYVMDMIVAGILLAASICLILIAFLVLRFTISFTLTEEYREIGVMKAIGLRNVHIRGLYMVKYLLLAAAGALVGFLGSIPFGNMMLKSVSESMVLGGVGSYFINAACSFTVVLIIGAFCFGCTGKVNKFTPVDAIRSGATGERFQKKGVLRLSKSPLRPAPFLAANDVFSSPKRFITVILTFTLCLSLVLILVTSVNTLKSDHLVTAFGTVQSDIFLMDTQNYDFKEIISENGRENAEVMLAQMEKKLAEHGMEARCSTEVRLSPTLTHGNATCKASVYQGIGTTAGQYDYYKGTPPQNDREIAITQQAADELGVGIGNTVTVQLLEGEREFMVTALFQSMMDTGGGAARLHESVKFNYAQLSGVYPFQIDFTDDPDEKQLQSRMETLRALLGGKIYTAGEYVESLVGIVDTLNGVRSMLLAVTLIITLLVTVLMERSFLTKERGEIAILKAIGLGSGTIIGWHTLRFGVVAVISAVVALVLHVPLTRLSVGPIFSMMGANFGIKYEIIPLEVYGVYPAIVLAVTMAGAFFTALYIRRIPASESSNIE